MCCLCLAAAQSDEESSTSKLSGRQWAVEAGGVQVRQLARGNGEQDSGGTPLVAGGCEASMSVAVGLLQLLEQMVRSAGGGSGSAEE